VTASRSALVVASRRYRDPKLRQLRSPTHDAKALAGVLGDPSIGAFDVEVSLDEPEHTVRRKLAGFFKTRDRDDLLLHFSCHGVKDEDGNLYFATPDTELEHLDATAVPAEFVNRLMNRSPSRRIVLLLDCCYAGAFGKGVLHRAGAGVELKERFDGRGRVVLTASNSMEYAFEGDTLKGAGTPSVFTNALVAGLRTGAADRDHDGFVSIDELYDYLYDRVREETPNQTPSKWTYDLQGDLVVAQNPEGSVVRPGQLPAALVHAMESPIHHVREGSVQALGELLQGRDAPLALAARDALEQLRTDDSHRVSVAAAAALGEAAAAPAAVPAREPPARARPPAPVPRPAVPAGSSLVVALAAVAAATLLVAVGQIVLRGNTSSPARALFVEPIVLAVLAPLVALASRRGWLRPDLAIGALTGIAVQTCAAGLGWLGASEGLGGLLKDTSSVSIGFSGLRSLFAVGALVLILAAVVATARAGGRALLTAKADSARGVAAAVALGGATLCFAALFMPLRNEIGDRHEIWSEGAINTPWVGFEPIGALLAVVALALASVLRRGDVLFRAGTLLALGVGLLLYFAAYVASVHYHAAGTYGPGGIIGAFGGIAIAAAGLQLRAGADARPGSITPA
jgi:hypothetical protein